MINEPIILFPGDLQTSSSPYDYFIDGPDDVYDFDSSFDIEEYLNLVWYGFCSSDKKDLLL